MRSYVLRMLIESMVDQATNCSQMDLGNNNLDLC